MPSFMGFPITYRKGSIPGRWVVSLDGAAVGWVDKGADGWSGYVRKQDGRGHDIGTRKHRADTAEHIAYVWYRDYRDSDTHSRFRGHHDLRTVR